MITTAQQIARPLGGNRAQRLADIDRAQAISIADPLNDPVLVLIPRAAVATLFRAASPETFSAVCQALADAADAGEEIDRVRFLDAVDRAQNLAAACGLVRPIGQDAVQAIMAQAFKRCVHHRSSAEPQPQYDQAAESTVEALMHSLRERGAAALLDRACRDRLADLSSDQIREVIKRLIALRPRYPKITDELLFKLGGLL